MKPFVTDLGKAVQMKDVGSGQEMALPRFAAWTWNAAKRRHEVAETSEDVDGLCAKYRVNRSEVLPLPTGQAIEPAGGGHAGPESN